MSKITTIPFAGFYNSIWSEGLNYAEEMYLENLGVPFAFGVLTMIDVTFKLERASLKGNITRVKLKGDDTAEWIVDTNRPDTPEGFVALQPWCSGSYRWLNKEVLK